LTLPPASLLPPKAVSPLRAATAVQILAVWRPNWVLGRARELQFGIVFNSKRGFHNASTLKNDNI